MGRVCCLVPQDTRISGRNLGSSDLTISIFGRNSSLSPFTLSDSPTHTFNRFLAHPGGSAD
jgi:hypothetical protein